MFNMAAVVGDSGKMNENWLVMRARACGKADPYSAKAWLITARTLYPHNFIIQVLNCNFDRDCSHGFPVTLRM